MQKIGRNTPRWPQHKAKPLTHIRFRRHTRRGNGTANKKAGDYTSFIDAEVVIDPEIFNDKCWEKGEAFRFRYYNYDLHGSKVKYAYENALLNLSEKLRLSIGRFATVITFKRNYWEKTIQEWQPKDIEGFRKNPEFVIKHILMQECKNALLTLILQAVCIFVKK